MLSSRVICRASRRLNSCGRPVSSKLNYISTATPKYTIPTVRCFSQSLPTLKKRKPEPAAHESSRKSNDNASPATSSSKGQSAIEDPLDFSALTAAYTPIDSHFKTQLSNIVHGGRFNPDQLGALSVAIKPDAEGENGGVFPLRELAQVVPRSGRIISLLVNDREYIKPIMSAVQASKDFNQQPQRSEENDLELLLRVEMERRDEVLRRIKDAAQGWRERIRQARSKHDKLLKDGKKSGAILPDTLKKAEKDLQKIQDKKMKDIDAEESQAVKQLDRH